VGGGQHADLGILLGVQADSLRTQRFYLVVGVPGLS
jgi:hypothetical protein